MNKDIKKIMNNIDNLISQNSNNIIQKEDERTEAQKLLSPTPNEAPNPYVLKVTSKNSPKNTDTY